MARHRPVVHFVDGLLPARDWQHRPQLDRLCEWWQAGGHGVCALVGIGGAGKTAIVDRLLRTLPGAMPDLPDIARRDDLPPPEAGFVFSFYLKPNADSFFGHLAAWLQDQAYDDSKPPPSYEQTRHLLVQRVRQSEGGILLLLDGLEKVQESGARGVFGQILDGRLRDLLRYLAGGYLGGVGIVITTRFPIACLDEERPPCYAPIPVADLPMDAGVRLLRDRGVRGSDRELERIVRECGCHALTIDMAGGYIAEFSGGDPATPLALGTAEEIEEAVKGEPNPRRRHVLRQEFRFARIAERYAEGFRDRDPAALALLQRICLFRLGVAADTLAAIFLGPGKEEVSGPALAALTPEQLQRKLDVLTAMRLLDASAPQSALPPAQSAIGNRQSAITYTVHPAVRDGFLASLDDETARRGHEAAKEGLKALLGERPSGYPSDPATLDLLEEIVYHTLEAGHPQEAWDIYEQWVGQFENLGWRLGAYERGERICRAFARGHPPQTAALRNGPSPDYRGVFINEWALYLSELGRLDEAARCYEGGNETLMRQENWEGASTCHHNLAEVWLLAGRLAAGLRAAEEALRLADRADDDWERSESHAYRGHARALRGETDAALGDFRDALHWQHEGEGRTDWPLYSLRGVRHTLLLARLGQKEEATRLTKANDEACIKVAGTPNHMYFPQIRLVLADLARERDDLAEARELLAQAQDWAVARDAREVLCWAALVRARIALDEAVAEQRISNTEHRMSNVEVKREEARTAVEEGLRIARECGYGIFHIDLLVERARVALLMGDAKATEADARVALDEGVHPPEETGLPELLAATDRECGYAWGEGDARHLLAEALLLRAAQALGRADFAPARFDDLPTAVRECIDAAREQLTVCRELRQRIQDPKAAQTEALLDELAGGVLTSYPLEVIPLPAAQPPAPPLGESAPEDEGEQAVAAQSKRFRVALSFPGERRDFVAEVADRLSAAIGRDRVFYDRYYEAELARPNLDTYLQGIYHDESDLIVVFLCAEYERKEWCGLEWRAVRDLLKRKQESAIMPFRFDDTHIPGLFSIDGYVEIRERTPGEVADLILGRLDINERQGGSSASAAPDGA